MKLITMTDFVLNQEQKLNESHLIAEPAIDSIFNYAKFLKQPLTLGMFMPCDEEGNVLKEPYEVYDDETEEFIDYMVDFHEAKDKVLFKTDIDLSTAKFHVSQNRIIEYFTAFEVELTEISVERIFGKACC